MGWEQIKGQDRAVAILRRALQHKRLPHAYLFIGPEGVGKKLLAQSLAKAVNCREQGIDSCGCCPACHKVEKGIHPDVTLIQPEEGDTVKIEQIRRLQEEIAYKPFEGYFKVWIIDQADKMTQQAANCLLKTLEEPPASSLIILLTSHEEALLPTIISRCQPVNFARLSREIIREIMIKKGISPIRLDSAVALADGGLSQVDRFQSEDFWNWREEALNNLQNCLGKMQNIMALGEKLSKDKKQVEEFLLFTNLWYRDLLVLKLGLTEQLLINQDKLELLQQQAASSDINGLQDCLGQLQQAFSAFQFNANPRLILENTLINLNL